MRDPYVQRARALIGTRFRAQGREPASGLDCIGLVAAVFGIPGERLPRDYRLRGGAIARLQHGLDAYFRRVRPSLANAGDVLLFEVSADQLHLGIVTPSGFVHADAGLRRVVETPAVAAWPVLSAHRRKRIRR